MSIEAMRAVWQHSETRGNARMVLTLIANSANPQGWDSYQFQETLAEAANVGVRTVERAIEEAVKLGELEVHRPDRTKQNRYSIMLPGLPIFDDESERDRRDEVYAGLALGRAEKTRQNRANRRSGDPTAVTGPSATGPVSPDGCGPDSCDGSGPDSTDGWDPTAVTGPLKEETSLNTNETTVKGIALAAERLWSRYPHHRRNLSPQRTQDTLRGLGIDDAAGIDRVVAALEEDIRGKDFVDGFIPKFSAWLTDRQWDRPAPAAELKTVDDLASSDDPTDRAIAELLTEEAA